MLYENLRTKIHEIVFEADTPAGKAFDVFLMISISASILIVIFESVNAYALVLGKIFYKIEWGFTIIFTIEYIIRILVVRKPVNYIFSFFGIIDLISILPTYLLLLGYGSTGFLVIRSLRLLRMFRIFKMSRYMSESKMIVTALKNSRRKILVFIYAVVMIIIIIGTLIFFVEGPQSGFNSIPLGIYWAIVTLTTVGYGDLTPITALGQFVASLVMLLGYAIIAVPTGIVTSEFGNVKKKEVNSQVCSNCLHDEHDSDAKYCKKCGTSL